MGNQREKKPYPTESVRHTQHPIGSSPPYICYILGPMQGAFFIFHPLTKPFPSRDQPPIHLNHMTNHLTSHLTTHMTSHMPFQSPAPQSHLSSITCSQSHLRITWYSLTWPHMIPSLPLTRLYSLTSASPPDSRPAYYTFLITLFYDSYWLPFLLPSRVSQFRSIWLHFLDYDSLLVQVLVVLGLSHTASSHVYKPLCFPRVGP